MNTEPQRRDAPHKAGVLVVSAWIDDDAGGFRARVLRSTDTDNEGVIAWVATSADVTALVDEWLRDLIERSRHPPCGSR